VGLFQKRLQLVLQPHRLRVNWYFLRVTVRTDAARASAKAQISSRATTVSPGVRIRKILLAAPRSAVRLRLSQMQVPDLRLAPSRFSRNGFQSFPALPTTGFQILGRRSMILPRPLARAAMRSDRSCRGCCKHPPLKLVLRFHFHVQTQLQPASFYGHQSRIL